MRLNSQLTWSVFQVDLVGSLSSQHEMIIAEMKSVQRNVDNSQAQFGALGVTNLQNLEDLITHAKDELEKVSKSSTSLKDFITVAAQLKKSMSKTSSCSFCGQAAGPEQIAHLEKQVTESESALASSQAGGSSKINEVNSLLQKLEGLQILQSELAQLKKQESELRKMNDEEICLPELEVIAEIQCGSTVLVTSTNLWSLDPQWPENVNAVPMMLEMLNQNSHPVDAAPAEGDVFQEMVQRAAASKAESVTNAGWSPLGSQMMECLSTNTSDELQALLSNLIAAREDRVKLLLEAAQTTCSSAALQSELNSKAREQKDFSDRTECASHFMSHLSPEAIQVVQVLSSKWTDGSGVSWNSINFSLVDLMELQSHTELLATITVQMYCNELQPWPKPGVFSPRTLTLVISIGIDCIDECAADQWLSRFWRSAKMVNILHVHSCPFFHAFLLSFLYLYFLYFLYCFC